MEKIFFDSWESLARTAIIGLFAYIILVLMLRIAGSRTLSQLNAFDFIVTVALGSTLATILLNKNVALADGLLAMALLITFQFIISRLSLKSKRIRKMIKTEPRVLFYEGQYVEQALDDCRISKEEVMQMMRSEGVASLDEVGAVVLESNGRFSVIKKIKKEGRSALENAKM